MEKDTGPVRGRAGGQPGNPGGQGNPGAKESAAEVNLKIIQVLPERETTLFRGYKTKNPPLNKLKADFLLVIPLGFEPRTHTLKVYCSTS
jgi:hypothetical protein